LENGAEKDASRRVIKRYSNRKLYDTRDSRYVTLLQIAEMVRSGEDVQIIDNTTKEDKTEVTLALAISEELKTKPRSVPLGTLRTLIQERGERLLNSLREGAIARLIPGSPAPEAKDGAKPEAKGDPASGGQPGGTSTAGSEDPAQVRHESRKSLAELVASSRNTLDQWQHAIDERIRAVLPGVSQLTEIQAEIKRLSQRLEHLEAKLGIASGEPQSAQEGKNSAEAGASERKE
jgi:polyhydroxyalkanoate synthesis repressor PhaR